MKKIKRKLTFITAISLLTFSKHFSQSTISGIGIGNIRPILPAFLGWNGAGPNQGPLDVRNDFNNHIAFFTAGPNNTRMRIFGNGLSPSCPLGGGIGINPNPANPITAPGSFLHIGLTTLLIH